MTKEETTKKKVNEAFMRPMKPSDELAAIIGSKEALPRTQATKKLWDYIKANKLQDDKDKRMINSDSLLKKIFDNKEKVNMFEIAKFLSSHLSAA